MKPQRVARKRGGPGWRVRWTVGGQKRSRTLDSRQDALDFQADLRRRRKLGTLADLDSGHELLGEYVLEWREKYELPNLSAATRRRYAQVWDSHVRDRLGHYELRQLTPAVVTDFRRDLERAKVGAATIRKAMFLVQSVMAFAVVQGRVTTNPVRPVRKPRSQSRPVRPLAPETVEAIRAKLDKTSATLVSLLAYAGLRPGEPLDLRWGQVRERTIHVERARKTYAERTVRLLGPLAQDLAEYRMAEGRPPDAAPVFARRDGEPWSEGDFRNWRRRKLRVAAKDAGHEGLRPYDLRHSFVSLLIQEGQSVVEVARQAGHSPQECLRTYAHVFEEFDPAERVSAEERIREARGPKTDRKTGEAGA